MWADELDWVQQAELTRSYVRRKRWEARGLIMVAAEMMGATQGAASQRQTIRAQGKSYSKVSPDAALLRMGVKL